jgi:hypothetical protein
MNWKEELQKQKRFEKVIIERERQSFIKLLEELAGEEIDWQKDLPPDGLYNYLREDFVAGYNKKRQEIVDLIKKIKYEKSMPILQNKTKPQEQDNDLY